MIRKDEILEMAGKLGLQPQVVEKDYALGWFLAGINNHDLFKNNWVFKGGTCLKKCYFETYRFSEDLDFTVVGQTGALTADVLKSSLLEVADWIQENAGLEIPAETIEFEVFENPRGTVSVQGKAAYRGPVRPQINARGLPRIKIDLTLDEPLVLPPGVIKSVDHPYSDAPAGGIVSLAYAYEEVFAEKTRALAQRLRPRDLYDVIHLFRRRDLNPDRALVYSTLESKCQLRGISIPTFESIQTHENRAFLESEWETMLAHQLPALPPFQQFLDELPDVLSWIRGDKIEEPAPLEIEQGAEHEIEDISPDVIGPEIGASNFEKVRFAAASRLLLRLGYDGTYRNVEPYSFARSSEGRLLLYAVKAGTDETRSYRFDRVESIEITTLSFAPRHRIEITSSGFMPVHQLTRAPRASGSSYGRGSRSGPVYVFQCGRCGKQFRRKTHDSSLLEHKKPGGGTCYGTYARYLRREQ